MVGKNKKRIFGIWVGLVALCMSISVPVFAAVSISVTEQNPVQPPSVNSFLGTQKNDSISFSMFQNSTAISDTLDLSLFVELASEEITTTTAYNFTFKVSPNVDLADSVTARAAGTLSASKKRVGYTMKVNGLAPGKKYYAQLVDTQYKMETPITNFTTAGQATDPTKDDLNRQKDPQGGDGKDPQGGGGKDPQGGGGDGQNQPVVVIENPINVDSIQGFTEKVLGVLMKIAIPLVGFFIIYSGFKFVLAQGNAEKLEAAKRTFLYTLIGAALLLGAWGIASIVSSTIEALTK